MIRIVGLQSGVNLKGDLQLIKVNKPFSLLLSRYLRFELPADKLSSGSR